MKTIRMKKEDWEKWDAALRSGEYGQCEGHLTNGEGGYCCLGVLEKALSGKTEDNGDELPSTEWLERHGIKFNSGPDAAATVAGRAPLITVDGKPTLASVVNDEMIYGESSDNVDEHKYDFIVIADAIKEAVEFTDA